MLYNGVDANMENQTAIDQTSTKLFVLEAPVQGGEEQKDVLDPWERDVLVRSGVLRFRHCLYGYRHDAPRSKLSESSNF
jgi:hypothetical protein